MSGPMVIIYQNQDGDLEARYTEPGVNQRFHGWQIIQLLMRVHTLVIESLIARKNDGR